MSNEESTTTVEEILAGSSSMDEVKAEEGTSEEVNHAERLMELIDFASVAEEVTSEEAVELYEFLKATVKAAEARSETKRGSKELTADEQAIVDSHLTPAEAAVQLKVSDRALRKAIRGGAVQAVKVGGRWYISQLEVIGVKAQMDADAKAAEEAAKAEAELDADLDTELELTAEADEADAKAIAAHEELVNAIKELDLTS
ncbi:MAG: hypothetical protein AMJ88_13700 [Anaerolineae bacterium SM23_ 63]|nr:MAG: hypothetical protein AMJ88_13700 [Anaerolineae bacterium SM23_ 63]